MGPCFDGGLYWYDNGFIRIPNQGPIQGDHGSTLDFSCLKNGKPHSPVAPVAQQLASRKISETVRDRLQKANCLCA